MISVDTGLIALMGKPLRQSFSPRMQNEAYAALGLDYVYFPLEVGNVHLGEMVAAFRHLNSPGFAVTKPNKIKVLEYLDGLHELAEKMGAVNTVVKRDGQLIGYNTDGEGFVRSLLAESQVQLEESLFFCCGAGGAGRAICSSLAYHGAKALFISDFHDQAAQSLVDDINSKFAPVATFIPFGDKAAQKQAIAQSQVVMNNSGVGMYPYLDDTPLPQDWLQAGQIAFDATYNPLKTRFLAEAEEQGCQIINGVGMVLYQGAMQVNLWSGQPEPVEIMSQSICKIIQEMEEQKNNTPGG